jgi:thiamine pyrophosphate-dependent acetolactate synthase large subunit-like protein
MSDKTHVHDSGESYSGIVPAKPSNKSGGPTEETEEGRTLTKENVGQPNPNWTPSQGSGPSGLDRVREAAKKDGKLRFTALLHHSQLSCCEIVWSLVDQSKFWAARCLTMNGKRRLLGSFSHGSMASALPQAIGAQLVYPDRQVITLSGDGGLAMLMGDLLSLRQLDLPVKMIVFNNSALAFVELEMKAAGMLDFATDLRNPDFAKMAESADVLGLRANAPEQVRPLLAQALSHPGPALVEVVVDRQELALPPSIKLDQVKGFSLFMMKAVIDGRGSEVIDLLKTNLF